MAHTSITKERVQVESDILKQDIADLFATVGTIKEVHLEEGESATNVFGALLNAEFKKDKILDDLKIMRGAGQLLHTSRTGWTQAALPTDAVLQNIANQLFARVQYHRLISPSSPVVAQAIIRSIFEKNKNSMIELLMGQDVKTSEDALSLAEVLEGVLNIIQREDDPERLKALVEAKGAQKIRNAFSHANTTYNWGVDINKAASVLGWVESCNEIQKVAQQKYKKLLSQVNLLVQTINGIDSGAELQRILKALTNDQEVTFDSFPKPPSHDEGNDALHDYISSQSTVLGLEKLTSGQCWFADEEEAATVRNALIALRVRLLFARVTDIAKLPVSPDTHDELTTYLNTHRSDLNLGDDVTIDKILPLNESEQVKLFHDAIIKRRTELLVEKIKGVTVSLDSVAQALAALPELLADAASNEVRTYILDNHEALGLSEDLADPLILPDSETDAIRDAIIAQRNYQAGKALTKQLISHFTKPTVKTDTLKQLADPKNNARAILFNKFKKNEQPVNADLLDNENIQAIQKAADQAYKQRHSTELAKNVIDKIKGVVTTIGSNQNNDVNKITDMIKLLKAVVEPPTSEGLTRDYLNEKRVDFGIDPEVNFEEINDEDIKGIKLEIEPEIVTLLGYQISANIQMITDPSPSKLEALKAVVDAKGEDAIRASLYNNQSELGEFDLTGRDTTLNSTEIIQNLATQKYNELLIKKTIAKCDDANVAHMRALKAVASLPENDPNKIREALKKSRVFRDVVGEVSLADPAALAIHKLATQQYNALYIKKGITECKEGVKLTALLEAVKTDLTNINANEIRKGLAAQRAEVCGAEVVGNLTDGSGVLSDNDALAIQKFMWQQALIATITTDPALENFSNPLADNAEEGVVKVYIVNLLQKTHYEHINKLPIDSLEQDHFQAIKDTIIARKENFITQKIAAEINKLSIYPPKSHPKLKQFINELPLDKKEALLEHDAKGLKSLMSARTDHTLLAAARGCGWALEAADAGHTRPLQPFALRELFIENKQHQALRGVFNSKIAEVLAEHAINLKADSALDGESIKNYEEVIKKWNTIILAEAKEPSADYAQFVKKLVDATVGLAVDKKNVLTQALKNAEVEIKTQHDLNKPFYDVYNQSHDSNLAINTAIYSALLAIEKTGDDPLEGQQIDQLVTAITDATTGDDLIKKVKALPSIVATLGGNWEARLRADVDLIQSRKIADQLSDSTQFREVIRDQKAQIKEMKDTFAQFSAANEVIGKELERLSRLSAFSWLNPDTEAIARQRAVEFGEKFEHLGTVCNDMCRALQVQKQNYQQLLDTIPTAVAINKKLGGGIISSERGKVNAHHAAINRELAEVSSMLARYEQLHRTLYGNPARQNEKGILFVMREAKNLKQIQPESDQWIDYNIAEKALAISSFFEKYQTAPSATGTSVQTTAPARGTERVFKNAGDLPAEKGRIHPTYAVANEEGDKLISASAYLEERKPSPKGAAQGFPELVTMTIVKYPTKEANAPVTPDQENQLKLAQVRFITEMAGDILARRGGPPTANNPLYLDGSNKEELGMLWTALVELGKTKNSPYQFGEDAIQLSDRASLHFDPKSQKGLFKNSYYKSHFKGDTGAPLRNMQASIKNFYSTGLGTKEVQEYHEQVGRDITSFYKAANKGIVKTGIEVMRREAGPDPDVDPGTGNGPKP
ncbi:MAG: hypothetical protein A3F46_08200 [Legionellales bacterium RIFCSPHIGHO2_12_FULL_42_9]|nr:MAG: hypothetical protein A3F46_08200 [Legionellales bacterium RIFCSPHIGHO2_12_FULL_42_9]